MPVLNKDAIIADNLECPYVFVYGTLMQGLSNHFILSSGGVPAKFLGEGTTKLRYRMVDLVSYPALTKAPSKLSMQPSAIARVRSKYRPAIGEIYKISPYSLAQCDILEGNGTFYQREIVDIVHEGTGKTIKCWIYLLCDPSFYQEEDDSRINSDDNYDWKLTAKNRK